MAIVACFNCARYHNDDAIEYHETKDPESATAPGLERPWCLTCISEVTANTQEALTYSTNIIEDNQGDK